MSSVLKIGGRGQDPLVKPRSQKSTALLQGSNVSTLTLRYRVVALGLSASGSGVWMILPSSSSLFCQYGSPGAGRSFSLLEPVTFPHIVTCKLWLSFSVSNTASAYSGTHCSKGGSFNRYESSRQLLKGMRTPTAGVTAIRAKKMKAMRLKGEGDWRVGLSLEIWRLLQKTSQGCRACRPPSLFRDCGNASCSAPDDDFTGITMSVGFLLRETGVPSFPGTRHRQRQQQLRSAPADVPIPSRIIVGREQKPKAAGPLTMALI